MSANDMVMSRGENNASDDDELKFISLNERNESSVTDPMRTKSCIMNLCTALVGCVM